MKKLHTYDKTPRKRYVQQKIWDSVAGILSNCTVLLGPTPKIYLENLVKYVASSRYALIYSYEIDFDALAQQLECINSLDTKIKKKIKANYDSVVNAEITRFIDLDLMQTIGTGKSIIEHLFKQQYQKYKKDSRRKVFTFNVCSRNSPPSVTIAFVEKMLNIKIQKTFTSLNDYCTEYTFIHNSKEFSIKAWAYADTIAMFTILIQY